MTNKLTLSIDSAVISTAKISAKRRKTSISKMVENYLRGLSEQTRKTYLSEKLAGCARKYKNFTDDKIKSAYVKKKFNV